MSNETEKAKGLKDNEVGQSEVDGLVIEPCPFCGEKIKIETVMKSYMPICEDRNCVAGEDGYWADTKEEAIAQANRRVLYDELRGLRMNETTKINLRNYAMSDQAKQDNTVSKSRSNVGLSVALTAEVILSVKEILDLAEFAGLSIDREKINSYEMETPIAIMKCPESMRWEDEPNTVYEYAAFYEEYPQEGQMPLGDGTNT